MSLQKLKSISTLPTSLSLFLLTPLLPFPYTYIFLFCLQPISHFCLLICHISNDFFYELDIFFRFFYLTIIWAYECNRVLSIWFFVIWKFACPHKQIFIIAFCQNVGLKLSTCIFFLHSLGQFISPNFSFILLLFLAHFIVQPIIDLFEVTWLDL